MNIKSMVSRDLWYREVFLQCKFPTNQAIHRYKSFSGFSPSRATSTFSKIIGLVLAKKIGKSMINPVLEADDSAWPFDFKLSQKASWAGRFLPRRWLVKVSGPSLPIPNNSFSRWLDDADCSDLNLPNNLYLPMPRSWLKIGIQFLRSLFQPSLALEVLFEDSFWRENDFFSFFYRNDRRELVFLIQAKVYKSCLGHWFLG